MGMVQFLRNLFSSGRGEPASDGPRPNETVAVIGDIHGCADLLAKLLDRLGRKHPNTKLIFVGDYVDRGPDSAEVLRILRGLPEGCVFLMGNHERMMLDFLDTPSEAGERWLRHGGIETLRSFGVEIADAPVAENYDVLSNALRDALPDGLEPWLRKLRLNWSSGNLWVTHAGPDPSKPIASQSDDVFIWGHNRFMRAARTDGQWVAHGHWIRERAEVSETRISVDTGAYKSGILTAAVISPDGKVAFVTS